MSGPVVDKPTRALLYRADVLRGLLLGSEERAVVADIFHSSKAREDAIARLMARFGVGEIVAQHMADQLAGSHTEAARHEREAELTEIEHELARRGVAPQAPATDDPR